MALFKDVPDGYPNQAEIEQQARIGTIKGVQKPDGLYYEPEREPNRRELAVILSRLNIGDKLKEYLYGTGQSAADNSGNA